MAANPFLVSLAAAVLVLGVIVVRSRRRHEVHALAAAPGARATSGLTALSAPALTFALAVMLVPFGIASAALGGPPVGLSVYFVLFVGGLIALTVARRSSH